MSHQLSGHLGNSATANKCQHEYSFASEHINEHVILCQCGC